MTDTVSVQGLPLGISSFTKIRDNNQLYVDKTRFIKKLEDLQFFYAFIVRPRRFGKTLFTNILEAYYDKYQADDFTRHFTGTYIGQNKTSEQGQYYVLHLDLSALTSNDLIRAFNSQLTSAFKNFFERYPVDGYQQFLDSDPGYPAEYIGEFFDFVKPLVKNRLYLIIDEYDQFANNILANDPETFREVTRDDGPVKNFYAQIKKYTRTDQVSRIFITGVTTISLDSMTSGFSIAEDISHNVLFTDMFGFTEAELRTLIQTSLKNNDNLSMDEEEIFARMKDCYNGYRFSEDSDITVFNSEACVYYLRSMQLQGKEPKPLTVRSIGTDTDKMERILALSDSDFVKKTVKKVITGEAIDFDGFSDNLNLNEKAMLNHTDTLSVLFYMGYLTLSTHSAAELVCPNKSMESQFISYYLNKIEGYSSFKVGDLRAKEIIQSMHRGNIRPLFSFVSAKLQPGTGVNAHRKLNESNIQTGIKAVVNITTDYRAYDETEAQGIGFTDLLLVPLKKTAPTYLIELKHVKPAEKSDSVIQQKLNDAKAQLDRYAAAEKLASVQHLVKVAAVFSNFELLAMESY